MADDVERKTVGGDGERRGAMSKSFSRTWNGYPKSCGCLSADSVRCGVFRLKGITGAPCYCLACHPRRVAASANKAGVYNFRCVCGANIPTANPTGKCWDCGRDWELDADGNYDPPMKETRRLLP